MIVICLLLGLYPLQHLLPLPWVFDAGDHLAHHRIKLQRQRTIWIGLQPFL
jgi:hypothetical protein